MEDALRTVWREQSRYNNWALVDDEEHFLAGAGIEVTLLACLAIALGCVKRAIRRCYGVILHSNLLARRERAGQELYWACYRTALRRNAPHIAEELAQETILLVLAKLPTLRDPRNLIAWSQTILKHLEIAQSKQLAAAAEPLAVDAGDQLADPLNLEEAIVAALSAGRLLTLIRSILRNQLELACVLRFAGLAEKPGETAAALGVKSSQVRVARYRAFQRLAADARFMRELRAITDTEGSADERK